MRILIQRVTHASVAIGGSIHSSIRNGLLILAGIEEADTADDVRWLAQKAANLRIFDDEQGEVLVVSQFTLMASTRKGNRPSYIRAARPETAVPLYEDFCRELSALLGKPVQTGSFGADMQVELLNDGPVTIWMDSKNRE